MGRGDDDGLFIRMLLCHNIDRVPIFDLEIIVDSGLYSYIITCSAAKIAHGNNR